MLTFKKVCFYCKIKSGGILIINIKIDTGNLYVFVSGYMCVTTKRYIEYVEYLFFHSSIPVLHDIYDEHIFLLEEKHVKKY